MTKRYIPKGREGYCDFVRQNYDTATGLAEATSTVLVKWRGRIHPRHIDIVDGDNGERKGPLEKFLKIDDGRQPTNFVKSRRAKHLPRSVARVRADCSNRRQMTRRI